MLRQVSCLQNLAGRCAGLGMASMHTMNSSPNLCVERTGIFLLIGAFFLAGVLMLALATRRKVGILPLAVPSPSTRALFFRVGMGLCWGAGAFLGLWLP